MKKLAFLPLVTLLMLSYSFHGVEVNASSDSAEKQRLEKIEANSTLENPPEDKVLVTFKLTNYDEPGFESFRVDGLLHNEGTEPLMRASVSMTFYDANGKYMGSTIGYPDFMDVQPGGEAPFTIDIVPGGPVDPNKIASINVLVNMPH